MKRNKWQGIACFLLASLMVGSSFAAPMRNENPTTPVPSQTATPSPNPTPNPSNTPKPTVTPSTLAPTTPTTKPTPMSPVQKPSSAPAKPSTPSAPTQKPCQPAKPMEPEGKPNMPADKPCEPAQKPNGSMTKPGASCKPADKPNAPSTKPCGPEQKPNGNMQKPGCQKPGCNAQKPFMLDHFKMIVNALKKLGVEEKQVVTYIKEGKKLEDILKAEKIKPKKFKKCILKEYNKVVDEAQKNGQITCEQSKQLKAAIKETINHWLPAASK